MKITHIVSIQNQGGVEILFKDLFLGTHLLGFEQDILSVGNKINPNLEQDLLGKGDIFSHNKLSHFIIPKLRFLREINFQRILKKTSADLFLNWNRLHGSTLINNKSKFIHYEHGTSWYHHDKKQIHQILNRTDMIIAASYAAKRMLELKYGQYFTHPVVVNRNPLPSSRVRRLERISSNKIRIGFAGRFHPVKAPWLVLHVLDGLKKEGMDVEAFFAGDGELLSQTKAFAHKLKVNDSVTFLGVLQDMPRFYSSLDYLICPSLREPFGLVPLEAMNQGCIPIVSAVDGLIESLNGFRDDLSLTPNLCRSDIEQLGGVFPGTIDYVYNPISDKLQEIKSIDPSLVVKKIMIFENDKNLKNQFINRIQEHSIQNFSFEQYLQRQIEIYMKCLNTLS